MYRFKSMPIHTFETAPFYPNILLVTLLSAVTDLEEHLHHWRATS